MARPRPVLGGGSPPSGAGRREEEQFTELRLHQHLKATLRPPQSHTKAIPKPPQSQTKATPKPTTQAISKAGGRGNRLFSQGLGHNENCCPGRRRLTGVRGPCLPRRRLQAMPEPLNSPGSLACTVAGAGCGDKAFHCQSYTNIIQVVFDNNLPTANL